MKLSALLALIEDPPSPIVVADSSTFRRAVRRTDILVPDADEVVIADNDPAFLDGFESMRRRDNWQGVSLADAARAIRVAFTPPAVTDRAYMALRVMLREEIERGDSIVLLRAGLSAYLAGFDAASKGTTELALALRAGFDANISGPPSLATTFGLFHPGLLPRRMAKWMQDCTNPYRDLQREGLPAPHGPGLMQAVNKAFVSAMRAEVADGDAAAVKRLFRWLKPADDVPTLAEGAGPALDALFDPWAERDPDEATRRRLIGSAVELFKDPRRSPWAGVREATLNTARRWLTQRSIFQFLEIVSIVEDSHMWADRRPLWEGLFKDKTITSAWPVLNPAGQQVARRLARTEEDSSYLGFGTVGTGKTCFLVMECGAAMVAEGSHSCRTRFFKRRNRDRPVLYKTTYDPSLLKSGLADDSFTHNATWERNVLNTMQKYRD